MNNQAGSASPVDKLLLPAAGVCALVGLCIYICNWFNALSSPYSINFEGPMLWSARALAAGQNIYALDSLKHEPWLATIYPPLYLCFAAALVKIFGVLYLPLRAANMLLATATGGLLFRVMTLSGSRLPACLCGLLFLFSFDVMCLQSFEARPDYLQIFLSVFMLERFVSAYLRPDKKDSFGAFLPVVILALLAVCVKQQSIVFLISLLLFLLLNKHGKLAGKFALSWLLGLGLLTAVLQISTGGFLAHLSFLAAAGSNSSVLVSNLASLGVDWLKVFWALLVVPCGILVIKSLEGVRSLPFILVAVSTMLFLYSMGIPASNTNHLMSALVALSWCLAICLDRLPGWVSIIGLIACCLSFPQLCEEALLRPVLLPHARKGAAVLQELHLAGKPVLTDDLYINIMTDSKPVLVDCATFLNVWSAKGSDFKELIEPLNEKRYAAVIINSSDSQLSGPTIWWPRPVVQAVRRNYHKTGELHCSGWSMDLFLPGSEPLPGRSN